jgi:hypothetical protein
MNDLNFKLNLSGDVIPKTNIWRASIREVKRELLQQGYRNISFTNYLNKDKAINLIEEGKYEVSECVDMIDVNLRSVSKKFKATVKLIGQGDITCEVESIKIGEV